MNVRMSFLILACVVGVLTSARILLYKVGVLSSFRILVREIGLLSSARILLYEAGVLSSFSVLVNEVCRHKLLPIAVFRCLKSAFHWLRSPSELVMCHEKADRLFEIFGRKHGSPWRGSVSFPLISVTTTELFPLISVTTTELIYFFCNVKLNQTVQAVLWIIRTHRFFTVVTSW